MAKNLIDIWFVTENGGDSIEKIAMLGPLGMLLRENSDWTYVAPDSAGINENTEGRIYAYDWLSDSEPLPDDFTDEDLTPAAVKKFDEGTLTVADLEGVAALIYDGTSED